MKYLSTLCCLMLVSFAGFSQFNADHRTNIAFQTQANGFLTSLPSPPPGTAGTYYLYDDWRTADIILTDNTTLPAIKVKIDLQANHLEITYDQSTKLLPVTRVSAMTLTSDTGEQVKFINEKSFAQSGGHLLEILVEDSISLLSKTTTEVIRASSNPNPMSNVTKSENQIVKKKSYFIVQGNKFVETTGGKAAFKHTMVDVFGQSVEPLLKKKNHRDAADLIALVTEMNTLK